MLFSMPLDADDGLAREAAIAFRTTGDFRAFKMRFYARQSRATTDGRSPRCRTAESARDDCFGRRAVDNFGQAPK